MATDTDPIVVDLAAGCALHFESVVVRRFLRVRRLEICNPVSPETESVWRKEYAAAVIQACREHTKVMKTEMSKHCNSALARKVVFLDWPPHNSESQKHTH